MLVSTCLYMCECVCNIYLNITEFYATLYGELLNYYWRYYEAAVKESVTKSHLRRKTIRRNVILFHPRPLKIAETILECIEPKALTFCGTIFKKWKILLILYILYIFTLEIPRRSKWKSTQAVVHADGSINENSHISVME